MIEFWIFHCYGVITHDHRFSSSNFYHQISPIWYLNANILPKSTTLMETIDFRAN